MSYNFEVQGGKSYNIPVGGKYCPDDIVITAAGGGVEINAITAPALPTFVTDGQIVVTTDIPAGTIYVDTDEPANPVSGDVWVVVGASENGVEFSESFRNGFNGAKQYSGSEWQFMSGYIGVSGVWRQFSITVPAAGTPLNNLTWAQIDFITTVGRAEEYFAIGDTKNILINGVTYAVEIVDFRHDNLAIGGKAGITFGLQNCLNTLYAMNNTNTNADGWSGSYMRSNLQTTIFAQLENDLKAVIKPVVKKTTAGNRSATIVATEDTLFLFSEIEIFGVNANSFAGEGEHYAFFTTANKRIKKLAGTARIWWLRSPTSISGSYFCYVSDNGETGRSSTAGGSGVAFGFCI